MPQLLLQVVDDFEDIFHLDDTCLGRCLYPFILCFLDTFLGLGQPMLMALFPRVVQVRRTKSEFCRISQRLSHANLFPPHRRYRTSSSS